MSWTVGQEATFLGEVEQRLDSVLRSAVLHPGRGILEEAARHLCLAPAKKRVRPRIVALFGQATAAAEALLVDVAIGAELIHAASLLHDDVIDQATERRGRAAVNVVWNNTVAVLSGDLLLTLAFMQLRKHPRELTDHAMAVVGEMAAGMMLESTCQGEAKTTLEDWRRVAEAKTGALFGWCGFCAGSNESSDAAARFDRACRHFGVAFQLADDLKDLTSSKEGKPPFADLRQRRPSYPLLVALQTRPELREQVQALWSTPTPNEAAIRDIAGIILSSGAIEATQEAIRQEVTQALDALGPWRDRVSTDELLQWADALLMSRKEASA